MAPAKKMFLVELNWLEVISQETTSKNADQSQEDGDENDVALKPSHKRTFSKTDDPDQRIAEGSSVPPSNKKAKSDASDTLSTSDSENDLESSWINVYGTNLLVPLTPHGPNIFYGCGDTLFTLFHTGEADEAALWPKSKIMHAYGALAETDDIKSMPCLSLSCDPKDLEPPQAKALKSDFEADDGWWYEVTLTRYLPTEAPKKLRVDVECGFYDVQGGVYGKSIGEWWISDISAAKGESEEAMTAMIDHVLQG